MAIMVEGFQLDYESHADFKIGLFVCDGTSESGMILVPS